jgi:hypothetical protein
VLGGVLVLCSNSKSKWHLRKKTNPAVTRQPTAMNLEKISKQLKAERLENERKRSAVDNEIEKVVGMESAKK